MKKTAGISLIILLGVILRLIFIDKPDGLWNDEYISWQIASVPFGIDFFKAVFSQCHMPFYYLYLKFFMNIFGNSDLILRLTSVLTGVISIPVMYKLGKEYDEKTAWYCTIFTAVSAFLIYFSQEVRLYSVLFLFSALCILFTIRYIKFQNIKNLILCIIFNFFVLFTHTIGFVFVFFNLIFISINIKSKKTICIIWSTITLLTGMLSPLIIKILSTRTFSQWWGHFSVSKICFLFTDYFSPVITNITNAPDNFFYAPELALYMIIPTIISVVFIYNALKGNTLNKQLFCLCASVLFVLIAVSLTGKLVFLTKYTIEIYPILILLACNGATVYKNRILKNILLIIYLIVSLGYILIHPYSAPKMHRAEGHKIVTNMLDNMNLKHGDYIVFLYYPETRFIKYFDFSWYNIVSINKGNFQDYLSPDVDYGHAYAEGKKIYRGLFLTDGNKYLQNKLQKEIFDNLEYGQSVVMVILDSVALYTPKNITDIAIEDTAYKNTPLLYLVFSYLKKEIFLDLAKNLNVVRVENKGKWTTVKFTKLNK